MKDQGNAIAVAAIVVFVLGLAVIGALWPSADGLARSVIGTRGLNVWLSQAGYDTASAHRRQSTEIGDVRLRILPVYDTDFRQAARTPTETTDRRAQQTQRDIDLAIVQSKLIEVETLVLLPKWRAGVLDLDLLDKQLLVDTSGVERILTQIEFPGLKIIRPDVNIWAENGLYIYRPQFFDGTSIVDQCKSGLETSAGILILKCRLSSGDTVHLVSDPDLFNNHGIGLGDNARIAREAVDAIVRGQSGLVYFDDSPELLLREGWEDEAEVSRRTAEDLARFLTYPFDIILLSIGLLFVLAFWRGAVRIGPIRNLSNDQIGASKSAAIAAKASLLRLVGQDASLAKEYIALRLDDLSRSLLGKRTDYPELAKKLEGKSPDYARQIDQAVHAISEVRSDVPPNQLIELIGSFELIYRRITDEFGHLSRRR